MTAERIVRGRGPLDRHGDPTTEPLACRRFRIFGPAPQALARLFEEVCGAGAGAIEGTIVEDAEGLELRVRAAGDSGSEAQGALDALDRRLAERLGLDLYGRDEETLALVVGRGLRGRGLSLATAESCTAGLLAGAVTRVPGSSAWFRGGLVAYADELKVTLAGVPPELLGRHGAVSEAVARALARAARTLCGADVGVGVTGIAGPGGGTDRKPVGLVHLALEDATGVAHRELRADGDREFVRARAVAAALDLVRRRLLEADPDGGRRR
jgi:nicotinamide-nucleotide amidase